MNPPLLSSSRKTISLFLLALTILLLGSAATPPTDMGPKPSMEFELSFVGGPALEVIDVQLLECADPSCAEAQPLEELGPQGISCNETTCSSLAYDYQEYHQLILEFSDGSRLESNIFQNDSFETHYRVSVRSDDLLVERTSGRSNPMGWMILGIIGASLLAVVVFGIMLVLLVLLIVRAGKGQESFQDSRLIYIGLWLTMIPSLAFASYFSLAIPATVVLELMLAAVYVRIVKRETLTTLTTVAAANLITLPALWFGLNIFAEGNSWAGLLFAEVFIWIGEAILLFLTQRRRLSWREAALLSLLLNGASFLIGLLLPV
jgi:hypothetical protein